MYEMSARIRFSETDETGHLSMSGLLRLFEDCGYFHALARGEGHQPGKPVLRTWYLLSWHIEAYRMPAVGDEVRIGTWIYGCGASVARKQLVLFDAAGERLAAGDTLWVYMDVAAERPTLPPPGIWLPEDYGERIPLGRTLRRITPSDPMADDTQKLPEDRVDARLLDINHHANNVLFTEYAMSLAGYRAGCRFLAAEFRRQAKAGATICPAVSSDAEGKTVTVFGTDGEILAVFRFE